MLLPGQAAQLNQRMLEDYDEVSYRIEIKLSNARAHLRTDAKYSVLIVPVQRRRSIEIFIPSSIQTRREASPQSQNATTDTAFSHLLP